MRHNLIKFSLGLLIIIAVFSVAAFLGFTYVTPTSYVKLGADSTIQFSLNAFDIVIAANSSDEDVDYIISGLDVRNKKISKSLEITVYKLIDSGYFSMNTSDSALIKVTNSDKNKEEKLLKNLNKEINNCLSEKGINKKAEATVDL